MATDVEILVIEISKYRGTTKVIAPKIKPPLAVDNASAAKARFQFGAKESAALTRGLAGPSWSIFSDLANATP